MTLKTGVMMLKIQLCFTGIRLNSNSLSVHNINGFIFLYFDQINTAFNEHK